jgi:hypothetical protein
MKMKKLFLLTVISALPLTMMAQDDDMYFVPSKKNVAQEAASYGMPKNTYYAGSTMSVDDYNRRSWTTVTPIDSTGNDIIDFSAVRGVYPDSTYSEAETADFQLTRKMSRFDDYTPSEAYWDGYRDGRWASPWYYSSWYWNDPWYWKDPWYYGRYGWYSPWYSPWYYGYYRPWHYGYYGWYGPRWYGGTVVHHHSTGRPVNHRRPIGGNNFGGYRDNTSRINSGINSNRGYNSSSFGGSRSSGSSGSSFGGGRSGGGGSFGGGRSATGGRNFGGRK